MEPLEEDYDAVRDYVGRELGMAHLAPLADAHPQGTIKGLVVQPGGRVFVPLHVSPNNTDCRPAVNVLWAMDTRCPCTTLRAATWAAIGVAPPAPGERRRVKIEGQEVQVTMAADDGGHGHGHDLDLLGGDALSALGATLTVDFAHLTRVKLVLRG